MKLVEIHWVDSIGMRIGWTDDKMEDGILDITTIGFLMAETENAYIVSSSFQHGGEFSYCPLKIPKVAVTGFWEIVRSIEERKATV